MCRTLEVVSGREAASAMPHHGKDAGKGAGRGAGKAGKGAGKVKGKVKGKKGDGRGVTRCRHARCNFRRALHIVIYCIGFIVATSATISDIYCCHCHF